MRVKRIIKKEIDVPQLGEKIKQAREASNRSLTQLSKDVGISRNYWYQLESETILGGLTEETLRKIEQVLGTDFGVHFEE